MHIPDHFIQGPVCLATTVLAAAGVGTAIIAAAKSREKPDISRMAASAAFIFAAQMINYPITNGTSAHFVGSALAGSLLGMPLGILVMTVVLVVQSLVFADGGITVMGANILNMALAGSFTGGLFRHFLAKKEINGLLKFMILAMGAWLSVILASTLCSVELAISGTVPLNLVLPVMTKAHCLAGIGEALITAVVFTLITPSAKIVTPKRKTLLLTVASVFLALVVSPFASSFPDGLEWTAVKIGFSGEAAPLLTHPFPDYSIPAISDSALSTSLAGIIGVIMVYTLLLMTGLAMGNKNRKTGLQGL